MNTKFIQEPKINIAKITPHSTKDRFSSQLPVFFLVFDLVGREWGLLILDVYWMMFVATGLLLERPYLPGFMHVG